ncbi:hypothetical protein [Reichenbachiella ulvae]|uniref:CHRD domain-containing protein n=1 Tax=Reichenbachiella ulvae TaxID=2980104 RepID=A0ABT3CUQ8_9BACT|nr:hypothetical protein [Reichenbachiella ulvae]MCV9387210.1 hypothetical protein [Reichenbachiella ulvae]
MLNTKNYLPRIWNVLMLGVAFVGLVSCSEDDGTDGEMMSMKYDYAFHNGQTVASAPYDGMHDATLSAQLMLEEMDGGTMVTVMLMNTVDGEMYPVHAHDAADPASTPNGTPYNESPNSDLLVQMAAGNGGTVTVSQMTEMSYEEITSSYEGFLVVHDPLQDINTADISTYLIVGSFAREQAMPAYESMSFSYDFNTGQVAEAYAYSGNHADNLSAMITVQELAEGQSRVTVDIMNTMDGETYHTHSHDAADPAETPNGTPYIESPNSDVFVQMIMGNGMTARGSQISTYSYTDLTTSYEAFFVVHDPLQTITTTDPTTYVILGSFAR